MPHESSNGLKRDSGGVRLFSDSKNVILVHRDDDEHGGGQVAKRQSRPDLGCRQKNRAVVDINFPNSNRDLWQIPTEICV